MANMHNKRKILREIALYFEKEAAAYRRKSINLEEKAKSYRNMTKNDYDDIYDAIVEDAIRERDSHRLRHC
jgi:chromosome segregation and condensation protein ScpB